MAYSPLALWQALSRICVVGTDQVAFPEELKTELKRLGVNTELPDVQLLQQALIVAGAQMKATLLARTDIPEGTIWQNTGQWRELPEPGQWFEALLHPQQRDCLEQVLIQLQHGKVLFPATALPALTEVLAEAGGARFYPYLDSRAIWFITSLGLLPEDTDLLGVQARTEKGDNPLHAKLQRYFRLNPKGRKQRRMLGYGVDRNLPEAEIQKALSDSYRSSKSDQRAWVAPLLYLMPETEAGGQIQQAVERLTLPPLKQGMKTDVWLKKVFQNGKVTDALADALRPEKKSAQDHTHVSLMAQLIACLPPDAWSEYDIDLRVLQAAEPLWSREISLQIADYHDTKLAVEWFKTLIELQKYFPSQYLDEQAKPVIGRLLPDEYVLKACSSAIHLGKYSAEVMAILVPRLGALLTPEDQKNVAIHWLLSATHPDFQAIIRQFVLCFRPEVAQSVIDYYAEHPQLYFFPGKQNFITELRRTALLRSQVERWLQEPA